APKEDGIIDKDLIYKTIKDCYEQGARYLSISSSGEPTLSPISVTKTLRLIYECRNERIEYSPINLYSNGIRIGEEKIFCDNYLPLWKDLGLTTIYVTVHDVDEVKNAIAYRIENYPPLDLVVSRIHDANLLMRANLVLSKKTMNSFDKFVSTVKHLKNIDVDSVSAWSIRNKEDRVDPDLSPLEEELDKIERWVESQNPEHKIRLLREKSKIAYKIGQKLTLFPNKTLSNTWCNY
ncbi:MAG: hypothetical protein KKF89_05945, partial [Nanoarchaeota archaeon]|nr:hypothetical protein [Nanoarchaeota archaeon]